MAEVRHRVLEVGRFNGVPVADVEKTLNGDSKFVLDEEKCFFVNPGSVGQPRDGDPRSAFGLLDAEKHEYELVRVTYQVKHAANRIIEEGLPHFLAERLSLGR